MIAMQLILGGYVLVSPSQARSGNSASSHGPLRLTLRYITPELPPELRDPHVPGGALPSAGGGTAYAGLQQLDAEGEQKGVPRGECGGSPVLLIGMGSSSGSQAWVKCSRPDGEGPKAIPYHSSLY